MWFEAQKAIRIKLKFLLKVFAVTFRFQGRMFHYVVLYIYMVFRTLTFNLSGRTPCFAQKPVKNKTFHINQLTHFKHKRSSST